MVRRILLEPLDHTHPPHVIVFLTYNLLFLQTLYINISSIMFLLCLLKNMFSFFFISRYQYIFLSVLNLSEIYIVKWAYMFSFETPFSIYTKILCTLNYKFNTYYIFSFIHLKKIIFFVLF